MRHPLVEQVRAAQGGSPIRRFVRAFLLPVRAMAFLARQRSLWPLVVVPACINVVLFAGGVVLLVSQADDWLGAWWAQPEAAAWINWVLVGLWYLAWLVAIVLGVILTYVLVLLVGGIVASPFNDALSERTEQVLTGRAEVPQPGDTFIGGVLSSMRSTAAITALYALLMIPVLLLNFVPALGSMAAVVLGGLLGAFFITFEYADTVLARYGLRLRAKLRLLRTNLALALGFGLGTSLLLWVPLLNMLCIPLAVVGGTALALALINTQEVA